MSSIKHVTTKTTRTLHHHHLPPPPPFRLSTAAAQQNHHHSVDEEEDTNKHLKSSFKDWFKTRNIASFDLIFQILNSQQQKECDKNDKWERRSRTTSWQPRSLSELRIPLTESLVLDILSYGDRRYGVVPCLSFFDWVEQQRHRDPNFCFRHTRATFHAIFKILTRANLITVMHEFLDRYYRRFEYDSVGGGVIRPGCGFYVILVRGYAMVGEPNLALHLFGKMRFNGLDLDPQSYHILLNSLVENGLFESFEAVSRQINARGFECDVTHTIRVKCLSRRKMFDEAEAYLRRIVLEMGNRRCGHIARIVVDALCKFQLFDRAGNVLEELREIGVTSLAPAYGSWLLTLVRLGKVDEALEFLKEKKLVEGYVPDVFRYNSLLYKLLKQNRLIEVYDLLIEMKEGGIVPDRVTMNIALCLFCKAGMVDVALDLYNSRSDYGLSPDGAVYNFLINSLCGDGEFDKAYRVFSDIVKHHGIFPGKKTITILADALCRERKLDNMKELIEAAIDRNITLSDSTYDKYISALCRDGKPEEGYLLHEVINKAGRVPAKATYMNMIHGFKRMLKGGIAARLLIEMQDKGHTAPRTLFRTVISCLLQTENSETQFANLLDMQIARCRLDVNMYNCFIDGAGHAKRPDLARQVFDMMQRSGLEPNRISEILMLQSYLMGEKFSDALNFFSELRQTGEIGKRLYHTMIVGFCKAKRADLALDFFMEMKKNGKVPSIQCYEDLVRVLCSDGEYDKVVYIVDDFEKVGYRVTSFMGHTLLWHALLSEELHEAWVRLREADNETCSNIGLLIDAFSRCVDHQINEWEEAIKQFFPVTIRTYNILLKKLCMTDIDRACELFNTIPQRGYDPNGWTYDILVCGLLKHGRFEEAKKRTEEMSGKGFQLRKPTSILLESKWRREHLI